MEVYESFNLAQAFEGYFKIIEKTDLINSENKENEEAFLNFFKLKQGENRTVNDFYRKQNVTSNNSSLGETKNSNCEDFYFKPESRNIKYVDKSIKRSKFINEKDLLSLSSYKFCKFSDIYNYSFKEEILKFELNKEKIQFSDYANLNLYNSLEQLLSINYRLKSNITVYKEMNCFYVKLFLQGKPKWVLIDEHFPVHGDSIRPAFIQPSKESSWIILYEKAYAKINRSYANCIRDLASDIFSVLTEAPLKSLNHSISSNSDIWKQIVISLKRGLILFTELDSLTIEQFNKEYFLSFFIIGAYTIKSKYYLKLHLPNLRNDNLSKKVQSTLQTPYISEEISTNTKIISSGEKDVFFVEFDFFIKTFAKTFILFYHENYIYNYKKTLLRERKYNVVKFNLRSNCHMFLSLILKQSKYYPSMSNYEVPISRLIICKRKSASHLARVSTIRFKEYSAFNEKKKDQSESLEFIDSAYGKEEKHLLELNLAAGEYYLIFKVFLDIPTHVVISTYSDHPITYEDTFSDEEKMILFGNNTFTYNALNSVFDSFIRNKYEAEEKLKEEYSIRKALYNNKLGYSIIRITNSSSNLLLFLSLGYEITGMQLVSHDQIKKFSRLMSESTNMNSKNTNEYISIDPGCYEILVFEWEKNCHEVSINFNFKINLESHYYFRHLIDDFSNFKRKFITKLVFYYEIPYKNAIYILFFNRSDKRYTLKAKFTNTNNIIFEGNKGDNIIELILNRFSKDYIHLRLVNTEEVKYKVDINLQEI